MTDDPSEARPVQGRDWSRSAHPERRCTAHRKTGEQCKNAAILGGTVCGFHGGRASAVKRAARQRLIDAQDRMAELLLGIAENGESESARLSAIKDALDRAGISAKTAVDVEVAQPLWLDALSGMTGIARISQEQSRAARGMAPPEPLALPPADPSEPIDAEVCEPPRPPDPYGGAAMPTRPTSGLQSMEDAITDIAESQRRGPVDGSRPHPARRIASRRGRGRYV